MWWIRVVELNIGLRGATQHGASPHAASNFIWTIKPSPDFKLTQLQMANMSQGSFQRTSLKIQSGAVSIQPLRIRIVKTWSFCYRIWSIPILSSLERQRSRCGRLRAWSQNAKRLKWKQNHDCLGR